MPAGPRSASDVAATDALIVRVDSIADDYYDALRAAFPEINTIIGDAEARHALGPKCDVRAFHDHVLENGAVTLPMLREQIARWIA